jgi:hypothetical protein
VSKPSAAEALYFKVMGDRMAEGLERCRANSKYIAVERSHPRGPMWETGTGLKAHDWFAIPLSKAAHDEYHADIPAFEAKYGTHAELLVAYWKDIGFRSWGMDGCRHEPEACGVV